MKRIGLILIVILLMALPMFSQAVSIPDTAFLYALIDEGVDTNGDSLISPAEAEVVTSLDVSGDHVFNEDSCWLSRTIASLSGIEAFVNLEYLDCRWNEISSLDVSSNSALRELDLSVCAMAYCHDGTLMALDLSKNTKLENLNCAGHPLTSLDISANTALKQLNCRANQLTSLDVSNNKLLEYLRCHDNLLTSLDISANSALKQLYCWDNQLTSLDVSNNTLLTGLYCSENQLASLNISNNTELGSLGIQQMSSLYEVCVWEIPNSITYDTTGSPNVYFTTDCVNQIVFIPDTAFLHALIDEGVDTNGDGQISHEEAKAVLSLDVANKGISNMKGIEAFVHLNTLTCYTNQLSSLDVTNNTSLFSLACFINQLSSLDVSNNTSLLSLECWGNQLPSLDVSNNTKLERLFCDGNHLTSLDFSNNTSLIDLRCSSNLIRG